MSPALLLALSGAVTSPPLATPTLLMEVDARHFAEESFGNDGFALARLRPGLRVEPAPNCRVVTAVEFAGETPTILDAYARLQLHPDWHLVVGHAKPPLFASFVQEPDHAGAMPERSPVVTGFGQRRDMGVEVQYTPDGLPLEARARLGNGTGSALGNDNTTPAAYAGLDLVLGRARRGASPENETSAFGLRVGAAASFETPRDRAGIAGGTAFGFTYARPVVVSGQRWVGESHVVAFLGPARLSVEGAFADESRSRDDDGDTRTPRVSTPAVDSYGLTAELAWMLAGAPRRPHQAPGGGALEATLRYDGLWLDRGAADVAENGAQGGSAAVKYWATDFLAAAIALDYTDFDIPPVEAPDRHRAWAITARGSFHWGLDAP